MTFIMLPDDMVLNCLARVSRLYYPILSLVSRRFRSLLTSLELYQTRTLLGCTESCLYVCIESHDDCNRTRLFTLCRRPTQNTAPNPTLCIKPNKFLTKKEKRSRDKNLLVFVATHKFSYTNWWDCHLIAVGCNVYQVSHYTLSRVKFMDCRNHTWHKAPSMSVVRGYPNVSVLDGKIYVAGGLGDYDSSNWIECFDPKTKSWEHVPSPAAELQEDFFLDSLAIDGKLYISGSEKKSNMVYKLKENKWDVVGLTNTGWITSYSCVIDNILFGYGWSEKLEWYDFDGGSWKALKGLKKLLKLLKDHNRIRLENFGGKLAVLWDKDVHEEKVIWCAEIALEKRNEHEIHGKVEWCSVVLTVPISCKFLLSFIVTV
ncbi:hypothetical protein CARUB_v10007503mg [Capsella rubella]|uniref:F-box domain-containing protein n=1 Tax=Capsella rubella TaxID=81985 RepID=R0F2D7_9BRAS|nr:putative F-box/kelch-repeat protein At4g11750 [Capsella rubella]EOA15837.1 hypothetical protein CARUB_v10007503mg [Capsella rubella]